MATSFKKTFVKNYNKVGEKVTTDTLYWKQLQTPVTKKEYGAITNIDFSPAAPNHFAVTNSTRVQVYSSTTLQILNTYSKFKEIAYCGSFRNDGRLMVAGGDEGVVRLFNVSERTMLRQFRGHEGSVHVCKFLSNNVQLMSGSDDNTVKIWDIPTEKELLTFTDHTDYVRCGVTSQSSNDIILSGSYDHTVRLYDTRIGESVLNVNHGAPVESLLMFPSGGIFISAGGSTVKVWDALSGGKLLTSLTHHHKTVTCLSFCSQYQRFMSGGLDRHVKIYDVGTYQVVHTLDYPGSILSIGVTPDDSLLAVGMVEGLLSLQKRKSDKEEMKAKKPTKKTVSFRYGLKGKTLIPKKDDYVVDHKRKEKLTNYEKYFKRFDHSKALSAVFEPAVRKKTPEVTIAVMQELIRRRAIKAALAGREGTGVNIIVSFIQRHLSNPRYSATLIDVANLIIDIYYPQISRSSVLESALHRLRYAVEKEVSYARQLYEVIGQLDTLFSASQQFQTSSNDIDTTVSSLSNSDTVLKPLAGVSMS
ncbi:snoRNA-binding rRNA-processing protein [Mactra antiquata]